MKSFKESIFYDFLVTTVRSLFDCCLAKSRDLAHLYTGEETLMMDIPYSVVNKE